MPWVDKETYFYHDFEEVNISPLSKLVHSLATILLSSSRNYHLRQFLYASKSLLAFTNNTISS